MDQEKVMNFEKRHGTDMLIKTVFSSLNRLMVDKGLITEDELCKSMMDEMELVDLLCSIGSKSKV